MLSFNMLIKELKNYLISEGANCACHLNTEDGVPEPTIIIPGSNLTENNFNINAIAYIYKIPPEELIANVRSHTIKQSDESSKQFDYLTMDECLQMNFAFCKTCTPMFGEVYRSHKIFHLWSSVGNLISKAIQPDNRFKKNNAIEDTINNSEISFKSENDDNETGSFEESDNWGKHNFVYVNPTNQFYENICEDEPQTNDPLSEEIKCEVYQIDLENNQDNSHSFSEIAGYKTSNDFDDTPNFDTHQTVCIKLEELEEEESSSQSENTLHKDTTNDTNNLFVEGPPFHCPYCTKMPPFKYPNGLRLHCKVDHQLIIPDSAFSKEALKNSDIQFKTHPTDIKGPPYQCPSCVEIFKIQTTFQNHCKTVHQLLIPRQRNSIAFPCCFCKKEFRQTSAWQYHCLIEHNCRFVCSLCKLAFKTIDELQAHYKTDCGRNGSLNKAHPTNLPRVAETEEQSIVDVNEDDIVDQPHHINDQIVTNAADPGNTESTSKVAHTSNNKFLFFPTKKSKTPPFLCPEYGCSQNFPEIPLLEDHCLDVHKLILKVKNTNMRTYFCYECTECTFGQEELKNHLKSAHYEKFVSCQRPSEDSSDPSAVCEKSRLKCNECGLSFEHYKLLQQHSFEIHSITLESYEQRFFNFICPGCDTLFETELGFSIHARQCSKKNKGAKEFSCKHCSTTFKSIQELATHLQYVHDIKTPNIFLKNDRNIPKCLYCLKVFISVRDLRYHKIFVRENSNNSSDNNESSSVTCHICKARFTTTTGLKVHQYYKHRKESSHCSHSLQAPFNCHICSKSFPTKRRLNSHILTHKKLKKTCKICGEEFLKSSYLRHMRMAHTGYKPYKCKFCDKTFIGSTNLRQHEVSIHSDACPFVCSICGRRFKLSMAMKYHEKTHNTEKLFLCPRCGSLFKSKTWYNVHMRCHKQDDLAGPNPKCSECNKTFSNGSKLRHHKRISHNKHGPLPCPICGKTFALKDYVTYHMRAMHPERGKK